MFRRTAVILSLILIGLFAIVAITTMAAPLDTTTQAAIIAPVTTPTRIPQPSGDGIAISRNNDAKIDTQHLMLMGPEICTAWGDPFSPITPTWSATSWIDPQDFLGTHTYQFRIRIPSDYPDDKVRVEILDPDSINQAENSAMVTYSQLAQTTDPSTFPSTPEERSCSSSQKNNCFINTQEKDLINGGTITIDHVNPLWFLRLDENRGIGTDACSTFPNYTPETNTQTRFYLSYFRTYHNRPAITGLGSYTGQVGDGIRDNGDHDTDLRWVSPGSPQNYDQATFVPTSFGSFTVDIEQDLPDIVIDPFTGEKFLYLSITTLSGGSENGFSIWAGPDNYTSTVPSNINDRNLYILNNPGAQDNEGIKVEAIDFLPQNTTSSDRRDYSLVELGPEYAGQTITVTLFDPDAGAKPPVVYWLDTLAFTPDESAEDGIDHAQTDWGVSFGGNDDPELGCFQGGSNYSAQCNNQWNDPVHTITLPSDQDCDYANPSVETCTPFYGGELQANYQSGAGDSFVWHASLPERPLFDNTQGCSAFPMGTDELNRSVLPPGIDPDAQNSWRTLDYPNPSPSYDQFINHTPNIPLPNAQPGMLFNFSSPTYFYFLAWNQCRMSSNDLTDSLTWPGNAKDYTELPGTCGITMAPPFPGFMNVNDHSDREMSLEDWVAVSTGSLMSSSVRDTLEGHIDIGRILRLLIWDETGEFGGSPAVKISRFGLFRIIGYNISQGSGDSVILVEFLGWDDSCGQMGTAIGNIELDGPSQGMINTNYTFTTTLSPLTITPPVTVTWSATDAATVSQTNQLETSHTFQWASSGVKTITVTAQNKDFAPITATHQITINRPVNLIIGPLHLITDLPVTPYEPAVFSTTITNTGDIDNNNQFFVDVFINPTEVYTDHIPIEQSSGYTAVSSLAANTSKIVTVTAPLGFAANVPTHTVYAMVDSLDFIAESMETDNISEPLIITGTLPGAAMMLTPSCTSSPQTQLTLVGANWPTDEHISIYFEEDLHTFIPAGHDGTFLSIWQETVTIGEDYEITAVSTSYNITSTLTTPCQPAGPGRPIIEGPNSGHVGEPLTFTAFTTATEPESVVLPLTYIWQISDTLTITHTNNLTDSITYSWAELGPQSISLQVENAYGTTFGSFSFAIVERDLYLPFITKSE